MTSARTAVVCVLLVVPLGALSIARGGALIPDTASYAHGRAWWSSPLTAIAGALDGRRAVDLLAVAALVAVALLLASGRERSALLLAGLTCAAECTPLGAGFLCAGADALGVAAVLVVARRQLRWRHLPLVACAHLVAALELAVALALRRWLRPGVAAVAAAVAAVLVLRHLDVVLGTSSQRTELQWRYLLPALAYFAATYTGSRGVPRALLPSTIASPAATDAAAPVRPPAPFRDAPVIAQSTWPARGPSPRPSGESVRTDVHPDAHNYERRPVAGAAPVTFDEMEPRRGRSTAEE